MCDIIGGIDMMIKLVVMKSNIMTIRSEKLIKELFRILIVEVIITIVIIIIEIMITYIIIINKKVTKIKHG